MNCRKKLTKVTDIVKNKKSSNTHNLKTENLKRHKSLLFYIISKEQSRKWVTQEIQYI